MAQSWADMKILYTDVHLHSLNPTNTLTSNLVASAVDDIHFYGPGFVSSSELASGLVSFIEQTGPYDALVLGPNVPIFAWKPSDVLAAANYARRYTALSSPTQDLVNYYEDVLASIPLAPVGLRFACLVTLDCYGCTQAHIDRIEQFDLHVIAPNSAFSTRLETQPEWVNQEAHFVRKKDRLSNAWTDFTSQKPERVLTTLHFVGDAEFSFRGLSARAGDVSIPGVEYVLRKQAVIALKTAGIQYSTKGFFVAFRLASRLGLPVFGRFTSLKLFNLLFFRDLLDTRYVYTARGAYGTPIRKFFEIPAAGALMVCSPPIGFAALGFKDGEHYVHAEPDQLPRVLKELKADPSRAQTIASAGRRLVFEKHSLRARAEQLRSCFDAILQGNYKGATWNDGTFKLITTTTSNDSA